MNQPPKVLEQLLARQGTLLSHSADRIQQAERLLRLWNEVGRRQPRSTHFRSENKNLLEQTRAFLGFESLAILGEVGTDDDET
jgi:hypothetical protein